jgi:hypothetical protein
MADFVKAKIAEKNGVELEWAEEYLLIPENFPFIDPGFIATDVKDAIVEAKNTGVPGPEGPQGPAGQDALRFEASVVSTLNVEVAHNFGKFPLDAVISLVISYEDNRYNQSQFNTSRFGTGVAISGTPTRIDPSTYTRDDDFLGNISTFTFSSPVTGKIILLG